MIKFGTRCHILDLPSEVFPVDIGVNFLETEAGSFVLGQQDQTISANTLISEGPIEVSTLHPDIQDLCSGIEVVKSIMVPANRSYEEISTFTLNSGKVIGELKTPCCVEEVDLNFSFS